MKRIDPRQQFSKKLAAWTARFWFLYMVIAAVMCVLVPDVADAAVYLAICSSVIMLINVWAYTHNSVYEKAILAGIEKARFGLTWKKGTGAGGVLRKEEPETSEESEDPEDEGETFYSWDPEEEGGSNG